MKGFCDEALILMPKRESLNKFDSIHIGKLRKAIVNIKSFLDVQEIQPCFLSTDDVASDYGDLEIPYKDMLSPSDRFFLSRTSGFKVPTCQSILPKYIEKTEKKYKKVKSDSVYGRLELIDKKQKFTASNYIKDCKLIFNLQVKSNAGYKVKSIKGDKRIIINVRVSDFGYDIMMSGVPIDGRFILADERTEYPVCDWKY